MKRLRKRQRGERAKVANEQEEEEDSAAMNLEETPGLTDAEQAAVMAYEEAHVLHVGSALEALLDAGST